MPTKVGDKLSGRYGDKGVISEIISDDEMPHDADGRPAELLLNPLGIISRTNPAQIIESALGKIAARVSRTRSRTSKILKTLPSTRLTS